MLSVNIYSVAEQPFQDRNGVRHAVYSGAAFAVGGNLPGNYTVVRQVNIHFSRLVIGEHGELAADGEALEPQDDDFNARMSLMETLSLLETSKQEYDGVARLGIEALALKLQGMRVKDIAEIYHVPPSHVGAWISRSAAKLRCDPRFLASLL